VYYSDGSNYTGFTTSSATGGGGGRIAIYYGTCSSSLNPAHVTANGGATGGGSGTVIFAVAPTITWASPAAITYGTALSATQLNATASSCTSTGVAGTFVYNPALGTVLAAGTQTVSVTFTPTDTTDYTTATASVSLPVNQATQTITFSNPGTQTYGVSPITLTATASSGLAVTYAVTSGPASVSGSTLTITGVGSVTVQASQAGNTNYSAATPVSYTFTVNQKATADFTLSANPSSYSLQWGQSGAVLLTLTPQNGFSQTVSFACSGLPSGASCSFSPATLTPQASSVSTTLTISTVVTAEQRRHRHLPWTAISVVLAICSLGSGMRRLLKLTGLLLLTLATAAATLLIGCGGGFSAAPSSTSISSTVTVTATAGTIQHQVTVALTLR
jgi:hypothetical protein